MSDPALVFLGVCERADYVQDIATGLHKWNVLGLKNVVSSIVYPLEVTEWRLGFAISIDSASPNYEIEIVDADSKRIGTIKISFQQTVPEDKDFILGKDNPAVGVVDKGHTIFFARAGDVGMMVRKPGTYLLRLMSEASPVVIGQLNFLAVDPPPLTEERVAAIRSEPKAVSAARMELGCKSCADKYRLYVSLDRDQQMETDGWLWYQDVADEFNCSCGVTNQDLSILRRNFHGLLGRKSRDLQGIHILPLYEESSIQTLRSKFKRLLNSDTKEEVLQRFISENTILLHQFPAEFIYSKPPILTSYVADFGILTPQRELVLIEIEKATTKLLKKDGGQTAELTHAIGQVQDWMHVIGEHRLAVLNEIGIDPKSVSVVRGVVIAGRDSGYDAEDMRKLKGTDFGQIRLLTYDDLLHSLDALSVQLESV